MKHSKSIDEAEIAKFSAMADEWWDLDGKFKPLHKFNPVRIGFIKDTIAAHCGKDLGRKGFVTPSSHSCQTTKGHEHVDGVTNPVQLPLEGVALLDIGCGGGLLAEPMARLGAAVTAIDASEKNIKIASLHAANVGLTIDYQCTSAEELAKKNKQFDVVLNMEVIEHVADVDSFLQASCALVKPGGLMILATLNRTMKSYALAIVGAEYLLRWLPRGTHNWEKFLRPSEIEKPLSDNGMTLQKIQGVSYNPLSDSWKLSEDIAVNYMVVAGKGS